MYSKLQYISQGNTSPEQIRNIQLALDGGCKWIQLRFKKSTETELSLSAEKIKLACDSYNAIFIINDNVKVAKSIDADGVHLGLEDTSIQQARQLLGEKKIIGGTANTLSDVLQRAGEQCNYIGLGPFRFTNTKEKLSPVLGIEGYQKIKNELKNRNIQIPVYAIGGIVLEDIEMLMKKGIHGVAVSGIITHHPDKKRLIEQLNTHLYATA